MLAPYVPKEFVQGLERDFGGKVRVRWSPQRNRWQIERKGREVSKAVDVRDRVDLFQRLKDGYYRILETSPGSLVCCGHCGVDYQTEIYSLVAPRCPRCERQELVMNWPLGEKLLEHLRFSDPDRDGLKRLERDQREAEKRAELEKDRHRKNIGESIWKEEFTNVFEIQSRGYTGKEHAWVDAPESKRFGGNLDGTD